jgi:hypothetical protein
MNIREELLVEHSKKQTLKIAKQIGTDKILFAELMQLFFAYEKIITQRAAMVVNACFTFYPELVAEHLEALILNLRNKNLHAAVKRNTVRILQFIQIPEKLQGEAFENCMKLLRDPEEPIAVKVFAMTVLFNLCKLYPELKNELRLVIEAQLPYGSTGFKNRGEKIVKSLKKGKDKLR